MALGRIVVFLLFAVVGIAMVGYGLTTYQNQHADVKQAVTVEGAVESSDVEHVSINSSSNPSAGHFEVVVRYTYTYEGQAYTSESVYPGAEKEIGTQEEAQEIADQYSPGEAVTVYVNQENPSRAYLIEDESFFNPFISTGIGALLAVPMLLAIGKEIVGGGSDS